jgi:hypothetical protein
MLSSELELNVEYGRRVASLLGTDNFGEIQTYIRRAVNGRSLSTKEKGIIEQAVYHIRSETASVQRESNALVSDASQILIATAYTSDYSIGVLCEKVNRLYAAAHGYSFHSVVKPLCEVSQAIHPKKHCTWYKIVMLRQLFEDVAVLQLRKVKYVMWIDADAIFANHTLTLEGVIERGGGRDLIIAEDMNTGCLLNAGVFMLRTTQWSRQLLDDVWNNDNYDDVCFYEQSALMRCLRVQKEGLEAVKPFHSYLPGAHHGVKLFPHTAVLPISEFNSNRGILCNDVDAFQQFADALRSGDARGGVFSASTAAVVRHSPVSVVQPDKGSPVRSACYVREGNYCALCQRTAGSKWKKDKAAAHHAVATSSLFIFHPAGMPNKLLMLHTAIHKYGITDYDLAADVLRGDGCSSDPVIGVAQSEAVEDGQRPATGLEGDMIQSGAVGTAPMRLVRGKMGQIPQTGQEHLLKRLTNCS